MPVGRGETALPHRQNKSPTSGDFIEEWRRYMFRNSLYAVAALLMTASAFVGTLAVMVSGIGAGLA